MDDQVSKSVSELIRNSKKNVFQLQLEERRWRPELTMKNQSSEMRDKYRGDTGTKDVDFEDTTKIGPQGFLLENHHKEGPSKVG